MFLGWDLWVAQLGDFSAVPAFQQRVVLQEVTVFADLRIHQLKVKEGRFKHGKIEKNTSYYHIFGSSFCIHCTWNILIYIAIYACDAMRKIPLLNLTGQNDSSITLTPKDLSAALDEILHATSNGWCHIFRNAIPRVKRSTPTGHGTPLEKQRKIKKNQRTRLSSFPKMSHWSFIHLSFDIAGLLGVLSNQPLNF